MRQATLTPLLSHRLVLIVPEGHPLAAKRSVYREDFLPFPLIAYNATCNETRLLIDRLLAPAVPNIICECEEEGSIAALVEKGRGVAVVPDLALLRRRRLRRIPIAGPVPERTLYLARAAHRPLSPQAESFSRFILQADLQTML